MHTWEVPVEPLRITLGRRSEVSVAHSLQLGVVGAPIGANGAARLHRIRNEAFQPGWRRVRDMAEPGLVNAVPGRLGGHCRHRLLPPGPAWCSRLPAAHGDLVHLDTAGQPVVSRTHHPTPQLVRSVPCRSVLAEAEEPLQAQRARTVLLRCDPSDRPEPQGERPAGVLKDCAGRRRSLMTAGLANPTTPRGGAGRGGPASPAYESVRPSQLRQVRMAGPLGGESPLKLHQRPWKALIHGLSHSELWCGESSTWVQTAFLMPQHIGVVEMSALPYPKQPLDDRTVTSKSRWTERTRRDERATSTSRRFSPAEGI